MKTTYFQNQRIIHQINFTKKVFFHIKNILRGQSIASIFSAENAEDDDFTDFFSLSPFINSTIKSGSFKKGGKIRNNSFE